MAGKRIVIPNYMPALDLNGDPVAGAKITFYENGTTTLKAIYTSAALNVAHPNPISANAAGVFASIFADEDEEFSVAITDADGNPISGLRNRDNVAPSLVYGQEAAESAADTVFTPAGTGAVVRTAQNKARDILSAADKSSLQVAIDQSVVEDRELYLPSGTYAHASLPDFASLRGEGPLQTILSRVSDTQDVLVNTSTVVSETVTLQNLKVSGGRYGLNLTTDEVPANYHLTNITFEGSALASLYSAKALILCKFDKVIFNGLVNQLEVATGTANVNYFLGCEFIELGGSAVKFAAASEANEFISCRFEARRVSDSTGLSVLDLNGTKGLRVRGGYFEGAHRTILTETNSQDTIWFENSRFSGQETSNLQQERFVSNGVVGFDSNEFVAGSYGARQMFTKGRNIGLDTRYSWLWKAKDDRVSHIISPVITGVVTATPKSLFAFAMTDPGGSFVHKAASGTLTLTVAGNQNDGTAIMSTYRRRFIVTGYASGNMAISWSSIEDVAHIAAAPAFNLSTTGASSTALTLQAGITLADIENCEMIAEIEMTSISNTTRTFITVAPVLATGPTHPSD